MTTNHPAALTELTLTGTPAEVSALTSIAARSGRLVHQTRPQPMAGADPRIRIRLFLHPTS
ncbi:MAG TPA: hypothetical protein VFB74_14635 [Kribbellaceae bacterium]|nr:hypothetical protein [Kribbellaceae bacterium]